MKLYGGTLNPHQKWWGFFVLGDTEKEHRWDRWNFVWKKGV